MRLAAAEAQAAASKEQQQLQLDLMKAKIEKQTEGALNALKEQLQIRDRESSFYRKAMCENTLGLGFGLFFGCQRGYVHHNCQICKHMLLG